MLDAMQINQLKQKLVPYISDKVPPYALFQAKTSDTTITAYQSNKVVFQGEGAELYAQGYQKNNPYPQAGSDEVGTGDYLGPVVVCAAYVSEENKKFVEDLKVNDSKQLNDDYIRQIAPALMKQVPYSLLVLENSKYNQVHKTNNLNAIKAKLHNQAYVHLRNKIKQLPSLSMVDQFTPKDSYYRYLIGEKEIIDCLQFETKAESKYISVAVASCIARYTFLTAMDQLSAKYEMTLPKGANSEVDAFAKRFVERYGMEELAKIAKLHFKNTDNLKD